MEAERKRERRTHGTRHSNANNNNSNPVVLVVERCRAGSTAQHSTAPTNDTERGSEQRAKRREAGLDPCLCALRSGVLRVWMRRIRVAAVVV